MRDILVLFYIFVFSLANAETLTEIKVGALQYSTINWELSHLKALELDRQHGFQLVVVPMANKMRPLLHCKVRRLTSLCQMCFGSLDNGILAKITKFYRCTK